jgi:hypothetical protein
MSMVFSQNWSKAGNIMRKAPVPVPVPVPASAAASVPALHQQSRVRNIVAVGTMSTTRSAPRGVRQLFNLGDIMANPGTPCKACGS